MFIYMQTYVAAYCLKHNYIQMSRLVFKPERTQIAIVVVLFLAGLASVAHCMIAIDSNLFNFPEQVLFCCLCIMTSNLYYSIATGLQFAHYVCASCCSSNRQKEAMKQKQSRKRTSLLDDRTALCASPDMDLQNTTYTVKSIVCHTIDFMGQTQERRLFISREEIWYILYPISVGVFVLFFCIPVYDVSCSVMLAFGLLVLGCFQECKRDMYWERSGLRRGVFLVMVLSAFVIVITLFILSYTVNSMQQNSISNEHNASVHAQFNMTANNIDYIQLLLHNDDILLNVDYPNRTDFTNYTRDTIIQEMMTIYADKNKLYSFLVRIPVWMWCFYTPFLLSTLPESARLPVILEISQSSMGNICAMVIFTIVTTCAIDWTKFYTGTNIVYIMVAPFFIWAAIYMVLKSSRNKTILYVACILIIFSYMKFAFVIGTSYHVHSKHVVRTFVFLAVSLCIHVICTILFVRSENLAIRLGWDKYDQDDMDSDTLSDFEDDILRNTEMSSVNSLSIEDVLQRVATDIKYSENIISKNHLKQKPGIREVPAVEMDIENHGPT